MFDNIGGKIKTLAVIVCILGIIASVIAAVSLWSQNSRYLETGWLGVITLVAGCLGSWVGSFFMYGFGQLIESTEANNALLRQIANKMPAQSAPVLGRATSAAAAFKPAVHTAAARSEWCCRQCGTVNKQTDIMCRDCGEYRK